MESNATFLNYKTGYRLWNVGRRSPLSPLKEFFLGSVTITGPNWPFSEKSESRCFRYLEHNSPVFDCKCGIHAFSKMEYMKDNWIRKGCIYGKVALWGRLIEHENGFRSQFAYPISIEGFKCFRCGKFFTLKKLLHFQELDFYYNLIYLYYPYCTDCNPHNPYSDGESFYTPEFVLNNIRKNYNISIER